MKKKRTIKLEKVSDKSLKFEEDSVVSEEVMSQAPLSRQEREKINNAGISVREYYMRLINWSNSIIFKPQLG